jgi:hypothetical protein
MEDLSLGLHPFALGNFAGDNLGDTIQARAEAFNLMLAGSTAPTLGKQYTFSTKEIHLPTEVYMAGLMHKTTSVIYDVVLGTGNPHASRYRYFCMNEWPELEATLHITGMENPTLLPSVLPRILRWVQVRHARYFKQRIDSPHPPNLPDYCLLVDAVLDRSWHILPSIPERYKLATRGIQPQPGHADPIKAPVGDPIEKKGKDKEGKDKAVLIQNSQASPVWVAALQESGKKLPDIQDHAPLTKHKLRDGKFVPVCLSWHLKGSCYTNCKRAISHRALTTEEQVAMTAMVAVHLANH